MKKLKAIIVDDEDGARRLLANLISEYTPNIEVVGEADCVPNAVLKINELKPDVVFLDIEMPTYNGFELLKFFKQIDFEIVFVTAYNDYALKAFEISALDYLLKPIRIDMLEKAFEKLASKKSLNSLSQERLQVLSENHKEKSNGPVKIAVPVKDGLEFIKVENIVLINAEGSYSEVFLKNRPKSVLVSKPLKFFSDVLELNVVFTKTHRSHLVNLGFIEKFDRQQNVLLLEGNLQAKVARELKSVFEEKLKLVGYHI